MSKIVKFFKRNERNGYMSNWWLADFEINGQVFDSVEQYMMWRKAMLFNDTYNANKILEETNPALIKKYGRAVKGFVGSEWDAIREEVVYQGCLAKFSQNEDLKQKLLSYDVDSIFVECSPYDRVWGIGLKASDSRSDNIETWEGQNLLGKCLSRVRKELEKE